MCVRQQKKQNDYFAFRIPQIPKHEKGGYQRFLKIRPAGGAVGGGDHPAYEGAGDDYRRTGDAQGGFPNVCTKIWWF